MIFRQSTGPLDIQDAREASRLPTLYIPLISDEGLSKVARTSALDPSQQINHKIIKLMREWKRMNRKFSVKQVVGTFTSSVGLDWRLSAKEREIWWGKSFSD